VQALLRVYRRATGRLRMMPDFIIVGAQRAGTTSLYRYLTAHPSVVAASRKEVHFFDIGYHEGLSWYRSHFPLRARKRYRERMRGRLFRTGEASPYYMFHPHALRRIAAALPHVKLIAILRNPIDRAYSQYHHEVRGGHERLPFEEAIDREPERLRDELPRLLADERFYSAAHQHHSYLSRGIYARQLRELYRLGLGDDRLMVLQSETFFADPGREFPRVLEFLGLPEWRPPTFERFNVLRYDQMGLATRERLRRFFEPHNRELYALLGRDLEWR
jgi:hypothetical protein